MVDPMLEIYRKDGGETTKMTILVLKHKIQHMD